MKAAIALFISGLIYASLADARAVAADYSQSYAILIKGALAGSETVTESAGEKDELLSTSEHEILVTDGLETKRMAFTTKMVLSKSTWLPISYACRYTSGSTQDSYDVEVKDDAITRTLNRGGRTSVVTVPLQPNMVILDYSVYHQYEYLVRRYDFKKGGRQLFADFVPVIGSDIPLALTLIGNEKLPLKKGTLSVRNFNLEFVGIWSGSLLVDEDGRLIRLLIPAQDLEVVRKDLLASDNSQD
jgi:hypothetical protein